MQSLIGPPRTPRDPRTQMYPPGAAGLGMSSAGPALVQLSGLQAQRQGGTRAHRSPGQWFQ
jgi:hypothetical protein